MLVLRLSGWSYHALKDLYGVDRTSVRHWCVHFKIEPRLSEYRPTRKERQKIEIDPPVPKILSKEYKYGHIFEEDAQVNPGKSYREYIEDHKRRDPKWKPHVNPYAPSPSNLYEI